MNDEQILFAGGDQEDINKYAAANGADLTELDLALDWLNKQYPKGVDLVYIDYRDELSDEQCQQYIKNNGSLYEEAMDWICDAQSEGYKEIKEQMETNLLIELEGDDEDTFREAVESMDSSNPYKDLLKNTRGKLFRYSTGYRVETDIASSKDELLKEAKNIAAMLGLDYIKHEKELYSLVAEATYGGVLAIFWYGDITDFDTSTDLEWIRFPKTLHLAIHDSWNGSGYDVTLELDKPLIMEYNSDYADVDSQLHYGYNEICGLYLPSYEGSVDLLSKLKDGETAVPLIK